MKKEDAKREIRVLWRQRPTSERTFPDVMIFYQQLRKEHPELLSFRYSPHCDLYQVVKAFVWDLVEGI
jgi:hypothetical protein